MLNLIKNKKKQEWLKKRKQEIQEMIKINLKIIKKKEKKENKENKKKKRKKKNVNFLLILLSLKIINYLLP